MRDVILWTVSGGVLIFVIGLISAIESRRQNISKLRKDAWLRDRAPNQAREKTSSIGVMDLAAKGTENSYSEEGLALAGAEQGRRH